MSNLQSKSCNKTFFRDFGTGKHDSKAYFNDKFLTFEWRGQKSWEDYGCFIINEKNDLHWKGINSKNNYSSPLYGSNSQTLSAVTFDPVKINLKLGLYGITKQDYAKFYAWMDPLVIDKLFFDYDKNYYYKVKVSNLKESTKYILGNQNNQEIYYVETSVTFEIQGESCGWSERLVSWYFTPNSQNGVWVRDGMNRNESLDNATWISELRNGVEIYIAGINSEVKTITAEVQVMDTPQNEKNNEITKQLFQINFTESGLKEEFSLVYNSNDGIVFNAENKQLITLADINSTIDSFNVSKFLLPSKIEDASYYINDSGSIIRDVQIRILINGEIIFKTYENKWKNSQGDNFVQDIQIVSRLKTPLI